MESQGIYKVCFPKMFPVLPLDISSIRTLVQISFEQRAVQTLRPAGSRSRPSVDVSTQDKTSQDTPRTLVVSSGHACRTALLKLFSFSDGASLAAINSRRLIWPHCLIQSKVFSYLRLHPHRASSSHSGHLV